MRKFSFLQLTAAVTMLAFGLTLAGSLVQPVDADWWQDFLDWLECFNANQAVDDAWEAVQKHCFDEWDPEKCDKAWEALGKAVAHRDEVCADEESSS
ncbi:MAG: hypothetical protein OXU36_08260 [Candidatus Poribacteria bacterium]|nr:hypothetical protein [Candidatus Poribacteria bacterium]